MQFVWGWRVGCNPPSVLGGIRLNGLPASLAEASSTPIRPFTPGDSRFNASTRHTQLGNLACLIFTCTGGRSVSALLPGLSPCALADAPVLLVGGVSSDAKRLKAARQLANPILIIVLSVNKVLRFDLRIIFK